MSEILPAIEIETAQNPDATVIWMHGLGDDGRGWSEVVPSLALPSDLAIRFLFPHAPVMPVTINNGIEMRAGYGIRQANLGQYLAAGEPIPTVPVAAARWVVAQRRGDAP